MIVKRILFGFFTGLLAVPLTMVGQSGNETQQDSIHQASADTIKEQKKQEDPAQKYRRTLQQTPTDTVYFFDRKTMYVNVMKITYDSVLYREEGETGLRSLDKDQVNKIKYNWGRLEILNEKPPRKQERYDWRKVKILKNKRRASGMHQVKEIIAKAKGSGRGFETPKSLEAKARTILRKKAANVNAPYVVITNKTITTAFGEIPSATLKGIAYSRKKPRGDEAAEKTQEEK